VAKKTTLKNRWINADLHIHTPASADYRDPSATYLDILQRAETRNVEMIAFTDHNTVNGYATMQREIEQLRYLRDLGRAEPNELKRLKDYERLLQKILVLPGFEFTATFGFHILAIFPPTKSIREIEYILLSLNVPLEAIEKGHSEVGASADVLRAYEAIHQGGGLVIAAHANSANGVAMRGMDFGGQTRIAYTQSEFLHALELTDLTSPNRNSTARFFNGTKTEYPRKMRCIQGSDAHALDTQTDKRGKQLTLGVGERTTEYLLTEPTFANLAELFQSSDFSRSRPYVQSGQKQDYVQTAREEGVSIIQSFHVSAQRQGGHLYNILVDVCAFANTNGGTIYIGLEADSTKPIVGVQNAQKVVNELSQAIDRSLSPQLKVELDILETQGQNVIRIRVPLGKARPYAVDEYKIYVRDEVESSLAVRDELVRLVEQGLQFAHSTSTQDLEASPSALVTDGLPHPSLPEAFSLRISIPQTGVEVVGTEKRNGQNYYIMCDLRTGNIVHHVKQESARKLWQYAIKQRESNPIDESKIQWASHSSAIGLWRVYKRGQDTRYDLVMRVDGGLRVFYGVSEAGMDGAWLQFIESEEA